MAAIGGASGQKRWRRGGEKTGGVRFSIEGLSNYHVHVMHLMVYKSGSSWFIWVSRPC